MTERSRFWDNASIGDAAEAPYDASTEFAAVMMAMTGAGGKTNRGGVFRGDLNVLLPTILAANTLQIASGHGQVYGTWYESDANTSINIPTPASSTRVDRIVLRKSWASQTVRLTRIAGVEGSGAPAMTQAAGTTWDVPICQVSITTGAVMTLTDQREFIGSQLLTFEFAAGGMTPANTNGATFGNNTSGSDKAVAQFAYSASVQQVANMPPVVVPYSYGGGSFSIDIYWFTTNASQSVTWDWLAAAVTPGAASANPAPSSKVTPVTQSSSGSAGYLNVTTLTWSASLPAAGDLLYQQLRRNINGGTDAAQVIAVVVRS